MSATLKKLHKELGKFGILMLTDTNLPSLTTIVAGEPIKGSWWGHPRGNLMYNLSNELMGQADILTVKLINKKVSFVQKKHWDALFAIGAAKEDWQLKKLSKECINLLRLVDSKGELRADDPKLKKSAGEIGKLAAKLEERLLLYSESVHTESGKHVRVLRTWQALAEAKGCKIKKDNYHKASTHFENLQNELVEKFGGIIHLPWKK